jgi:hypothetical protein
MEINRITYSIKPSFAKESFCEIEKNTHRATFSVFVKNGNGQRQVQVSEESVLPILDAVKQLRLPIHDDDCGFDGTTYELTIGRTNRVTYSWWENLPEEWAELGKIVSAIVAISGIIEQGV